MSEALESKTISTPQNLLEEFQVIPDLHWIQKNVQGTGHVKFSGEMHFFGEWDGSWVAHKGAPASLWIGEGASFKGRIECPVVLVQGVLKDVEVVCEEIRVLKGAKVFGKISFVRCVIEEGALVEGDFQKIKE